MTAPTPPPPDASPLAAYAWPSAHVADALRALATVSGLGLAPDASLRDDTPHDEESLRALGLSLGLSLDPVQAPWRGATALVSGGPMLARLPDGTGFFLLLAARRGRARLLTPALTVVDVPATLVRDALRAPHVSAALTQVDADLDLIGVPAPRRAKARTLLLDERLGLRPAVVAFVVRAAGSRSIISHLREVGLFSALGALLAALVTHYALGLFAWIFLAWGALAGRVDPGWLIAWTLALASQVALRGVLLDATGKLALRGGAAVKRLLLIGALRGDLDQMRAHGMGGIIGRTVESEAFEQLALNGGMRLVIGTWELVVALVIASQGAGGTLLVLLGLLALVAAALTGLRFLRKKDEWTRARLAITGDLIERMVGHRTRLAQESPSTWHSGEDQALSDYVQRSAAPDELEAALTVWPRRAFMALGMLIVALAAGTAPDPLGIGLGLAGLLLGAQALDATAGGVAAIAGAVVARRVIRDLIDAARRPERIGAIFPAAPAPAPAPAAPTTTTSTAASSVPATSHTPPTPVLTLSRVGYTYPGRARPVLRDVDLELADGERLLLEGGSGSGKSTLAAIMAGLRLPSEGLVLLRGLDPATWGEASWRRRAVASPQFHDNRVIAGTFAFNLLLGRGGLPEPSALSEAEALCRELGLGPLIERMPAGLLQQVGESGWQLSHGERSRLYLARALLQNADLVLLDESFGALDPENQGKALACALSRARTLVVIAHP